MKKTRISLKAKYFVMYVVYGIMCIVFGLFPDLVEGGTSKILSYSAVVVMLAAVIYICKCESDVEDEMFVNNMRRARSEALLLICVISMIMSLFRLKFGYALKLADGFIIAGLGYVISGVRFLILEGDE